MAKKIRGERRQKIYNIIADANGISTGQIYVATGAFGNLGKETYTRGSLRSMHERGLLLRTRGNEPGKRGASNYVYFTATADGRRKMREFIASGSKLTGHIPQTRTATAIDTARRTEEKREAYPARRGVGRPRKDATPVTPIDLTGASGSAQPMVQGLVRINLKDGAHDIRVSEARILLKELHEILA